MMPGVFRQAQCPVQDVLADSMPRVSRILVGIDRLPTKVGKSKK